MEHVPGRSINLAMSIRGRSALREVGLEDEIIKNLSTHKDCKSDSTNDKLQKDLEAMTAKYEALKIQHESEMN